MHALAPRLATWLTPLLLLFGCFSGRTGGPDPSGDRDAGPSNIAASVMCGDAVCSSTTTDARWGAEPCCLEEPAQDGSPCGLEADDPHVSYAGVEVPISDILKDAQDNGEAIVNIDAVVECQARNQPGAPDDRCPTAMIGGGAADAGLGDASVDAGMASMPYEVIGCCRPDGMCGYIDPTTDFGCVLISKSIVGQAFGSDDQPCE